MGKTYVYYCHPQELPFLKLFCVLILLNSITVRLANDYSDWKKKFLLYQIKAEV